MTKLQWYGMYRNTIISAVLQCNVLQFMLTSIHRQKYHLVTTDKSNTVHCYTLIKTILHVMPTLWQCSWCYNKKNMFSLHKWCKCECKYCKTYLSQDTQWTLLHCKQCMWMFIACLDVSRSLSSLFLFIIFFWFPPFGYLYLHWILQNVITDNIII